MHVVTAIPGRSRLIGRVIGRLIGGLVTACLWAGLLPALTSCGTRAGNVALPNEPAHVQLPGAAAARTSARGLVIAAYKGYWRATNDALAARHASKAAAIMARYVPARSVPTLVTGLKAIWRRNEIGYGSPVFHIMSVKITGRGTAAVHDCVDLSHMGLANRQTGVVVGGFGQSHDFLTTTLALKHGRWLVTGAIPVVQTCSY